MRERVRGTQKFCVTLRESGKNSIAHAGDVETESPLCILHLPLSTVSPLSTLHFPLSTFLDNVLKNGDSTDHGYLHAWG